ncbi:hypothetical protein [Brevibacillus sp. NRS-1366]|uniref:hypothetical protein n=1 Tax=Brevibacillus sp. NRS-1366 TaxID=3233899 RepID=UPI003D1B94CE
MEVQQMKEYDLEDFIREMTALVDRAESDSERVTYAERRRICPPFAIQRSPRTI